MGLFEKELQDKIKNDFDTIKDSILDPEFLSQAIAAEKQLDQEKLNYKKGHNKFLYGFLWFLFIIFIWTIFVPLLLRKKLKQLKENKKMLKGNISKQAEDVLNKHTLLAQGVNIVAIDQIKDKTIKYQHQGPINYQLIKELQASSLFDLSYDENSNTYNTSWGILDNKVVLHSNKQKHREFMKTYTGSISVSYTTRDSEGNTHYETEIVTASVTKIAYDIYTEKNTFAFMSGCSELEFDFERKKHKLGDGSFNKKHNYAALENKQFEKTFLWTRNNDTQFRMIFTPYTQEAFLEETNNGSDIRPEHEWHKAKAFIFNEFRSWIHEKGLYPSLIQTCNRFCNDTNFKTESLMDTLKQNLVDYNREIYKSLNYNWLTTIMASDDHKYIINKVNKQDLTNNYSPLIAHNILVDYFKFNIKEADLNIFSIFENYNKQQHAGLDVIKTNFNLLSYKKIPRVDYVNEYAHQAGRMVSVPVHWDEYIQLNDTADFSIIYLPSNYYYFFKEGKLLTNINDQDILAIFKKLERTKVCYKNNILAFVDNGNVDYDQIASLKTKLKNKTYTEASTAEAEASEAQ